MKTSEITKFVKIPKGYRRLRQGEVIPNNYLGYFGRYSQEEKLKNILLNREETIVEFG